MSTVRLDLGCLEIKERERQRQALPVNSKDKYFYLGSKKLQRNNTVEQQFNSKLQFAEEEI